MAKEIWNCTENGFVLGKSPREMERLQTESEKALDLESELNGAIALPKGIVMNAEDDLNATTIKVIHLVNTARGVSTELCYDNDTKSLGSVTRKMFVR